MRKRVDLSNDAARLTSVRRQTSDSEQARCHVIEKPSRFEGLGYRSDQRLGSIDFKG